MIDAESRTEAEVHRAPTPPSRVVRRAHRGPRRGADVESSTVPPSKRKRSSWGRKKDTVATPDETVDATPAATDDIAEPRLPTRPKAPSLRTAHRREPDPELVLVPHRHGGACAEGRRRRRGRVVRRCRRLRRRDDSALPRRPGRGAHEVRDRRDRGERDHHAVDLHARRHGQAAGSVRQVSRRRLRGRLQALHRCDRRTEQAGAGLATTPRCSARPSNRCRRRRPRRSSTPTRWPPVR